MPTPCSPPGRRIVFLKWRDPIAPILDGDADGGDADEGDAEWQEAADSFLDEDDVVPSGRKAARTDTGPCLVGPMGVVPVHESNLPSRLYNFWMGHANFDLTPRVVEDIARVPGVESLDVFSRYRFRMAVGKAFGQDEVKAAVQRAVGVKGVPESNAGLTRLRRHLTKKYPYWAIVTDPDGKTDAAGGQTVEDVRRQLGDRRGEVETSW